VKSSILFVAVSLIALAIRVDGQIRPNWTTYNNPTLGFSFRYPAATLELKAAMQPLGEESEIIAFLDLNTREIDPQRAYLGRVTALRVVVRQAGQKGNVLYRPTSIDFYRQVARKGSFRDLKVGGRRQGNMSLAAAPHVIGRL
jgi:hypothetical protein